MKTIILYASKHGATKEVAEIISAKIPDVIVEDINKFKGNIKEYQNIVLGSKTKVGKIDKKIKEVYNQIDQTSQKVIIFIVGLQKENFDKLIIENVNSEAVSSSYFVGGKLNFPKMNIAEKTIIKMINKEAHLIDVIDTKKEYDFLEYQEIDKIIDSIREK